MLDVFTIYHNEGDIITLGLVLVEGKNGRLYKDMTKAGTRTKLMCLVLAIAVAIAMLPVFAFTANAATGKYTVTAKRQGKIKYQWGGWITTISKDKKTSAVKTYSGAKTYTIRTYKGFTLDDVTLYNKDTKKTVSVKKECKAVKGTTDLTYTFAAETKGNYKLSAKWKRTGLFIKIDPGHAGNYNRGYYKRYWESHMTWKLSNELKKELEKYPNVVVSLTKKSLYQDPMVYNRGLKAKGYDLFLSIHSNDAGRARSTDYPLTIVSSGNALKNTAAPLGKKLAAKVKTTMKCRQDYQVWVKRQNDGRDWYGVIRGSAARKVPGIIIEHGFHSNPKNCKWLMKDLNLKKMARNEAAVIANYWGIMKDGSVVEPGSMNGFRITSKSAAHISLAWYQEPKTTAYQIWRSTTGEKGTFKRIKTIKDTSVVSYRDTKVKKGKYYHYKVRAIRYMTDGKMKKGAFSSVIGTNAK